MLARLVPTVVILALLIGASSCADGSHANSPAAATASRPTIVFPRRDDLARLPSLPPPRDAFVLDAIAAELWTFASPAALDDDDASYRDSSAWDGVVREFVRTNKGTRLSPALLCAASELARFFVERGGVPTESLRRFTVARCGAALSNVRPLVYSGEAPEKMSDDVFFAQAKAPVAEMLTKYIGVGAHSLGLASARSGKKFAIIALVGADDVRFETTSRSIDSSRRIAVRGALRAAAADVNATINIGDYSLSACDRDGSVASPRFAFSCRLADGDKSAWVQVSVRRHGRLLEDPVADLLAHEGDAAALEYRPRSSGTPAPIATADAFAPALLTALNRVRGTAKMAPLILAAKQSAEATRLTGTLIDAITHARGDEADRIVLGLLAGWDVGETIRAGNFFVGQVAPTRDAMAWLDFALERPMGRRALLDAKARRIAIGPAIPEGASGLAASVATYQLFDDSNEQADSAHAFARVNEAREANGHGAIARMTPAPDLRAQADLVLAGRREPMRALDAAIHMIAQTAMGRVSGWLVETNDLDRGEIPVALLRAQTGELAVEVTHHRVDGAAWGQYVVLYVLVQ